MRTLFKHNVLIQSLSNSQTSTGTYNPAYATRIASVDCALQHKMLRTLNEFGKLTIRKIVRMYCEKTDTGTDLVLDGGFDDPAKWTAGSKWSIADGVATYTEDNGQPVEGDISQTLDITAGTPYTVTYTLTTTTGSMIPVLGGQNGTLRDASGTYTETIVAGSTDSLITFGGDDNLGGTMTIDNVSVEQIGTENIDETDRVVVTAGRFAGTYEILGIEDMGGRDRFLAIDLDLIPDTD